MYYYGYVYIYICIYIWGYITIKTNGICMYICIYVVGGFKHGCFFHFIYGMSSETH